MSRLNVKEIDKLPHFMITGSKEREILQEVKPAASIFIGTNFEYLMRSRGLQRCFSSV
jgi:hypothetical protein